MRGRWVFRRQGVAPTEKSDPRRPALGSRPARSGRGRRGARRRPRPSARTGDLQATRAAAGAAIDALNHGDGPLPAHDTLSGMYTHAHLASELAYASYVDPDAALRYLEQAGPTPDSMPRRAMAVQATRARSLLAQGHLDGAIEPARAAIAGQALLPRSARIADHAARLRHALAPYRSEPSVRQLVSAPA